MADNYLEKKFDEAFGTRKVTRRVGHTLDELLTRNRSTRGYDSRFCVGPHRLKQIIGVNTKIPSARNQQVLRFRPVHTPEECARVLSCIRMGAALPELHLPFPGTEPTAYIVICSTVEANPMVYIDLGISVQSMLLRATEMGLNGLCICAFNKKEITEKLQLPYEPLAVLAIGKGIERHRLATLDSPEQSHNYYRTEDGTLVIPKLPVGQLLIPSDKA